MLNARSLPYWVGGGVSPWTETPWTDTSQNRDPPPPYGDLPWQRLPTPRQRPSWTETPWAGSDIIQRPLPRGQKDACENITLPQTSFAGGNKAMRSGRVVKEPNVKYWIINTGLIFSQHRKKTMALRRFRFHVKFQGRRVCSRSSTTRRWYTSTLPAGSSLRLINFSVVSTN